MKRKRSLSPAQRLRKLHLLLEKAYGPQHWWPAETPFEVVLGAYLTQNTSWTAAARSIANLRAAGALTPESIHKLSIEELQLLIRPSGFATRKAPALKAFVDMLGKEFGGSIDALAAMPTEPLRSRLLALPGVGPETADAILLYALNHPVPVVDEYLRRIVERHGLVSPPTLTAKNAVRMGHPPASPPTLTAMNPVRMGHPRCSVPSPGRKGYEQLADLVREAFAAENGDAKLRVLNESHALIVAVGKAHCRKIALCEGCPLKPDLPSRVRSN
jgi:endonuclease-3 related protein